MLLTDVFGIEVLAHTPPYFVVQRGKDTFTILEQALDFPYFDNEDPEEQWLNWLVEFSVSVNAKSHPSNVDAIHSGTHF